MEFLEYLLLLMLVCLMITMCIFVGYAIQWLKREISENNE